MEGDTRPIGEMRRVKYIKLCILAALLFQLTTLLVCDELVCVSLILQHKHVHHWFQPCHVPVYDLRQAPE